MAKSSAMTDRPSTSSESHEAPRPRPALGSLDFGTHLRHHRFGYVYVRTEHSTFTWLLEPMLERTLLAEPVRFGSAFGCRRGTGVIGLARRASSVATVNASPHEDEAGRAMAARALNPLSHSCR